MSIVDDHKYLQSKLTQELTNRKPDNYCWNFYMKLDLPLVVYNSVFTCSPG